MTLEAGNRLTCPGLPADWINGWLAAVGATVLDPELRLSWTTDPTPVAVLEHPDENPANRLVEAWPTRSRVDNMPLARLHDPDSKRPVPAVRFADTARVDATHPDAWTLTSAMTDLAVRDGNAVSGPFDPPGPGTIKWLHHRLTKTHSLVSDPSERIPATLAGAAEPEEGNGLGFDIARFRGNNSRQHGRDTPNQFIDPVVEVFAFFGLALFPVRGDGVASRNPRSRQRGWRVAAGYGFKWPAWDTPLVRHGIDALLDAWHSSWRLHKTRDRDSHEWKPSHDAWSRLGVHAAWESTRYESAGSDSNQGYGSRKL